MTQDQWITLGIILITVVLFISEWLSVDVIGMVIISLLIITGILSPLEAVAGFSNTATVTIAAMFVLSSALLKTGHLKIAGDYFAGLLAKNETKGVLALMIFVGVVSAFINNTPVVAIFIPVVVDACYKAQISASRILIPLSFASMFGGLCSLIGTSGNLLISSIAVEEGLEAFGIFEMAPIGIVLFVAGVIYLLLTRKKYIRDTGIPAPLLETYGMGNYLTDIRFLPTSPSVGKPLSESPILKLFDVEVIGFSRNKKKFVDPSLSKKIKAGDVLRLSCNLEEIKKINEREGIQILDDAAFMKDGKMSEEFALAEALITPGSELERKSISQSKFKSKYGAFVLAMRSRREILHKQIKKTFFKAGDILLITANKKVIEGYKAEQNQENTPFLIISKSDKHELVGRKDIVIVYSIIVMVVLLASFNVLPIMAAALIGVTFLLLIGFLDMPAVYKAINWQVVFMIAGTISLGLALEKTGTAKLLAEWLIRYTGDLGPVVLVASLYLITSVLTEIISNASSAVLLAPIAISAAEAIGASPRPFLLTIMFAASSSFMTPVGYQTNTMIYTAGNYKFFDFMKIGAPLNLLFWILTSILIPWYFDF